MWPHICSASEIGQRDLAEGRHLAENAISDGTGFQKFRVLVEAQGGDATYVDQPQKLPRATLVEQVLAPHGGWWLRLMRARSARQQSPWVPAAPARRTPWTTPSDS